MAYPTAWAMPESGTPATLSAVTPVVAAGQEPSALIPHLLDVDALIAGGGIAVIGPQEEQIFISFLAGLTISTPSG